MPANSAAMHILDYEAVPPDPAHTHSDAQNCRYPSLGLSGSVSAR